MMEEQFSKENGLGMHYMILIAERGAFFFNALQSVLCNSCASHELQIPLSLP